MPKLGTRHFVSRNPVEEEWHPNQSKAFSNPQGCKGSCHTQATQIKAHIKSYVNEDHLVMTASELRKAID